MKGEGQSSQVPIPALLLTGYMTLGQSPHFSEPSSIAGGHILRERLLCPQFLSATCRHGDWQGRDKKVSREQMGSKGQSGRQAGEASGVRP